MESSLKIVSGDIWTIVEREKQDFPNCVIVIPTNGITKANGALVMGAGLAKQARDRFPGLDHELGARIFFEGNRVMFMREWGICTFPTKNHWSENSTMALVMRSAKQLQEIALNNTHQTFFVPKVGTGMGGLKWDEVKPVLEKYLKVPNIVVVI